MPQLLTARWIMIGALSLTVAGCAAISTVAPLSVPLAYKPSTDNKAFLAGFSCPYVSRIQVIDKRPDPVLGVRVLESKPLQADVTASNDPAAWAQGGIETYLRQNQIKNGPTGPALVLEMQSLRTSEDIYHRSGYEAKIKVEASLQSPSGKSCWHAAMDGNGRNYGYAGSTENYQEMLNQALDDVSAQIVNSADFNTALCHCAD